MARRLSSGTLTGGYLGPYLEVTSPLIDVLKTLRIPDGKARQHSRRPRMVFSRTCVVNIVNSRNQRVRFWATTLKGLSALGTAMETQL